MASINIDHLTFHFSETKIFEDQSLSLKENGFYAIIGPNGAGKSTLLKLLLGILSPQKGSIEIFGKSPQSVRDQIGYVPQSLSFDVDFPILTHQFVQTGSLNKLNFWGRYPTKVKERSHNLLDSMGLDEFYKKPLGTLSGGQKQRASVARALMNDPPLLILDEPTSGMDKTATNNLHNILKKYQGQKTILMVTHSPQNIIQDVDGCILVDQCIKMIAKEDVCCHYALGVFHTHQKEDA